MFSSRFMLFPSKYIYFFRRIILSHFTFYSVDISQGPYHASLTDALTLKDIQNVSIYSRNTKGREGGERKTERGEADREVESVIESWERDRESCIEGLK